MSINKKQESSQSENIRLHHEAPYHDHQQGLNIKKMNRYNDNDHRHGHHKNVQINQQDQNGSLLHTHSHQKKGSPNISYLENNQLLLYLILAVILIIILIAICINFKIKLSAMQEKIEEYYFLDNPHDQQISGNDKSSLFTHSEMIDSSAHNELEQVLKGSFYDVHYFLKDSSQCPHQNPLVIHNASMASNYEQRPLLKITKTNQELQRIIQSMKYNKYRPKQIPKVKALKKLKPQSIDIAYFFYALVKQPNNTAYIQAEFYRYDQLYNISKYIKQLPLCVSLIGRNDGKNIEQLYQSISRQNYTNYKIIHIDDNSEDDTQQKLKALVKQNKVLSQRLTFLSQQRRRNQLFNRDLSIRHYCGEEDIILDMDADDYIIGNQVFQLVNSIYQAGHTYNEKTEQVWSLYFSHIVFNPYCQCILPNIDGEIPESDYTQHTYRATGRWRTTELRTFRKTLYLKIDPKDFIDEQSPNKQFYTQSSDAFINSAILELSGPKHLKTLDQFLYFYVISQQRALRRGASIDFFYSVYMAQSLTPYQSLQNLNDTVRRVERYNVTYKNYMHRKIKTWQTRELRDGFKDQLVSVLNKFKMNKRSEQV